MKSQIITFDLYQPEIVIIFSVFPLSNIILIQQGTRSC